MELTMPARVENIDPVTEMINARLEELDCPLKAQMQIDVAVDELFGNIAHYAYPEVGGDVTVRMEDDLQPPGVRITFLDRGIPYDPLAREDPDTTLAAEDRKIGGLGIFLVKKTMDAVLYDYRDGCNVLTIVKYF